MLFLNYLPLRYKRLLPHLSIIFSSVFLNTNFWLIYMQKCFDWIDQTFRLKVTDMNNKVFIYMWHIYLTIVAKVLIQGLFGMFRDNVKNSIKIWTKMHVHKLSKHISLFIHPWYSGIYRNEYKCLYASVKESGSLWC